MIAGLVSEIALLLLALAIGRWSGVGPFAHLGLDLKALVLGVLATGPMLLLLRWCLATGWHPVRDLVATVEERLGPYLADATGGGMLLLSLMAGLCEEALFRGAIQGGLATRVPEAAAVGIAAALFGVAHWLTWSYALLAGLIGIYLGAIFALTDNLLAPILAHGLYDLVALTVLQRRSPASRE